MINLVIKLLFSFLLTTSIVSSTKIESAENNLLKTNSKDSNGLKIGKWKYYGRDLPEYKYEDNRLVLEGFYKTGKREGEWIQYFKDGKTPSLIANYHNNRPQGMYRKYNGRGVLIESGQIKDNQYTGTISMFYDNGKLKYKGEFYNGIENGGIVQYDQYGNIALAYTSFNGVVNNQTIQSSKGNPIKKVDKGSQPKQKVNDKNRKNEEIQTQENVYMKGGDFDPNGYNKIYNEQNDILQDGTFRNGKLYDGKLYQYDNDRILFKVKIYKNGVYVGDGQI